MKKILCYILLAAIAFTPFYATSATKTLYSCYSSLGMSWGSVEDRAVEAAKYGIWQYRGTAEQNVAFMNALCSDDLGFTVITDYQKALSSPMTADQTFVPVTSLLLKDGTTLSMGVLGDKTFLTLEPGATNEEIVMCTGVDSSTKRFTPCTRGLAFSGTSTAAVTANKKTHSSGSTVVLSNVHYVYQQFLDLNEGIQTASGTYTFANFPKVTSTSATPTTNDQLTSKYYVDNQLAGGLSASNVSTTLGLITYTGLLNCITTGTCFGINASTTLGLGFFDDSGLNRSIGMKATSTQFTFDHLGNLAIDLAKNFTWTGIHTFSGLGQLFVPTPSANGEAANKGYVDTNIGYNTATGTAAVTIAAGQAIAINTTSTLVLASSAASSTSFGFVGIALTAATSGTQLTYVKPGGIADNLTGLSPGKAYFLSTAGSLSTSPGTISARIGRALSANRLQINTPSFFTRVSASVSLAFNGGVNTVTLGFSPTRIDFICNTGSPGGMGWWQLNSDGTSSTGSVGNDQSVAGNWFTTNYSACKWNEGGGNTAQFFVTRTESGFTMTPNGYANTRPIYYTATFDDVISQ